MANGLLDVELLRDILPRSIDVDTRYQNEINLFCHTRRSAIQSVSGLLSILDMHRERSVYKLGQTRVDEITRQGEKLLASLRAELRWALGLPKRGFTHETCEGDYMTWEELAAKINDMRVGDRQKTVRFVESYDKDFAINEPELLQATDVLSDGETTIQPEEFYLG